MPGLLSFALAGAAQGLGTGIVDQANKRREEALAAIARQQELEDRATARQQQLADRQDDRAYNMSLYGMERQDRLSDYDRQRRDSLEDQQRGFDREDSQTAEERAREDAAISRNVEALRGVFTPQSIERLGGVDPRLTQVLALARERTGINFEIGEGLRDQERQEQLVASGASQTSNSYHLHGNATDVVIMNEDGSPNWDFEAYRPLADAAKEIAAELGYDDLVWGGDWDSLKDGVHFQMGSSFDAEHGEPTGAPAMPSDAALAAMAADAGTVQEVLTDAYPPRGLAGAAGARSRIITGEEAAERDLDPNSRYNLRVDADGGEAATRISDGPSSDEEPAEVSAQTTLRIETEFEDPNLQAVLEEEVLDLKAQGMSEEDAYAKARAAMTFSRTVTEDGGMFGEDTERPERTTEYDKTDNIGVAFVGFNYDGTLDAAPGTNPPPPEPGMPSEPGALSDPADAARPMTEAERAALPSGTVYLALDGTWRRKP